MRLEVQPDGTIKIVSDETVGCPIDPQDALQCESCQ